ncbi:hypothetical protein D9758_018820 [Tetrapyrgos nigripes]|uniref:Uncharacterized protein n=1 Tax=Tetrapyrgos nigripes TaxID=182062 RepID=A0A8H5BVA9_9AGAR|nr:hypothetical protein D9758_018820 [Tetrapyrgos nigripes]
MFMRRLTCMCDWRIDGGLAESPKFVHLGSGTFNFLDGTKMGQRRQVSEGVCIAYFSRKDVQ